MGTERRRVATVRRILVDADGCPATVRTVVARRASESAEAAQAASIIVRWYSTHDHDLGLALAGDDPDDGGWVLVGKGPDAVDHRIASDVRRTDVVVTQDYGLAGLVLPKGARAVSPTGLIYSDANIDRLLAERFLSAKARRGGYRTRGPAKRTRDDDRRFEAALDEVLAGWRRGGE